MCERESANVCERGENERASEQGRTQWRSCVPVRRLDHMRVNVCQCSKEYTTTSSAVPQCCALTPHWITAGIPIGYVCFISGV